MTSASIAVPEWRIDGARKVTGGAVYAADVSRTAMLHAAFVTSPHPHARVLSVDVTAARSIPGVRAVITGADTRSARFGRYVQDWPVLASDRVRFIGDRVAAIAAETPEAADEAVRAVAVDYEPLPAIFDPEAALRPGAPVLHPDPSSYTVVSDDPTVRPTGTPDSVRFPRPNVQARMFHEHGDLAAGFARAARVFEQIFDTARIHNGYLEPRACVVWIDDGDKVHVLTTNRAPFALRYQMAATLALSEEQIDVETASIGGDFGGKALSLDESVCYFLARATGRPVRSVLRHIDDLQTAPTRRAARITLRTGVDRDGRITAHDARVLFDCGAYAAGGGSESVLPNASLFTIPGYRVPAARVEAIGVYTNNVPGGAMRAPAQPQITFASESHIDHMARELEQDPLEFRERNLAREGELTTRGDAWPGSEMDAVIAAVRSRTGWGRPLGRGRGRGISLGVRHQGTGSATVEATLSPDGRIDVITGVPDQGTGAHTVIQRVMANELGIASERVSVTAASTSVAPLDPGVGGSKSTILHGGAALEAAKRLRAAVSERAPGRTLDEAAASCGPLRVTGTFTEKRRSYAATAEVIEVSVDEETGAFRIQNASVVADVGTVINPVAARGQIEGGFAMGLGQALTENVVINDGRLAGPSLGDYKLPTCADIPAVDIIMHTSAPGFGPYGAKGVGENIHPLVGAAIANAIASAVGVRLTSLPLTADQLFAELAKVRKK